MRRRLSVIYNTIKFHYYNFPKLVGDYFNRKVFYDRLKRYKVKWDRSNNNIVLTQVIADYEMCIRLAAVSSTLAKKYSSNIGLYVVASRIEDARYRLPGFFKSILFILSDKKRDRVFLSFGGKIVYRNSDQIEDNLLIERLYSEIRVSVKDKMDIMKIAIEGLIVGDLIYDTYLRTANKPTVELSDPFFDHVIRQTLHMYYSTKRLLDKYNVTALVNPYTSYVHHGITTLLCLERNIPVYTVGSTNSLIHKVRRDYPRHHNNHFLYRKLFDKLDNKFELLEKAKQLYEKRFSGAIDTAIGYMKTSSFDSFQNESLTDIDWPNTVVVLAHCFFDSPHVYRNMPFPDLYEWLIFTLDVLSKQQTLTILVKPHPNGIDGNDQIFEKLKVHYAGRNISFIDKRTSNLQLLKSKPAAMITLFGTAASEFAYWGNRVISVFDNPYSAYNFALIAHSINEYEKMLSNATSLEIAPSKEEILEYYYMNNLFFLGGIEADYLNCAKYKGATYGDNFIKDYLPGMDDAYFLNLDSVIQKGFELVDWEEKNSA